MTGLQNYAGLVGGLNIPIGATQSVTGPAGAGQLTDSYLKQLLAGTSGVGGLLTTPLGSILGTDNKKTVGRSILDWIKGVGGEATAADTTGGYGAYNTAGNTPTGIEGYFWNSAGQLVDAYGNDALNAFQG